MAEDRRKSDQRIEGQLQQISQRLESIEDQMEQSRRPHDGCAPAIELMECCGLPATPTRELEAGIDPGRESLIRSIEKKWVNGTELKYYFYDKDPWAGNSRDKKVVTDAFKEWKSVGIGLSFKEVKSEFDADIRIGFQKGDGSWSYVGRDIWNRPVDQRTMNFGWSLDGEYGLETALHEIGHTLGFQHEQQNPFSGIVWDEEAVYRYFTGPPNYWTRPKTFYNVLRQLSPESVDGSKWDPHSIMQYAIRPGLIIEPEEFRNGLKPNPGLSDTDRSRVQAFYPEIKTELDELQPFDARRLQLAPADQADFQIKPNRTRRYRFQTFGASDTVMVLFEDNNSTLEHLAADDDSGWTRNASIHVRLVEGRKYTLRIRLYYANVSGDTAVMFW